MKLNMAEALLAYAAVSAAIDASYAGDYTKTALCADKENRRDADVSGTLLSEVNGNAHMEMGLLCPDGLKQTFQRISAVNNQGVELVCIFTFCCTPKKKKIYYAECKARGKDDSAIKDPTVDVTQMRYVFEAKTNIHKSNTFPKTTPLTVEMKTLNLCLYDNSTPKVTTGSCPAA